MDEELERRLDILEKGQEKQAKQINRLCNAILDDKNAGIKGYGSRVKELENKQEELSEKQTKLATVILTAGSIIGAAIGWLVSFLHR